jgi:hypothetical protein
MEAPPGGAVTGSTPATVTARGLTLRSDTTNEGRGLYLATSGDLNPATHGDFLTAMDNR